MWLIKRGADILTIDHHRKTLMHEAALTRQLELIPRLLDVGVPPNGVDRNGSTPLDYMQFIRGLPGGQAVYARFEAAGATNRSGIGPMGGRPIPPIAPSAGRPAE